MNVHKRVYYENNNEHRQTLIIKVDFFRTVCEIFIENFLQFVQIRNSSPFLQQSAKFVSKQQLR